MSNSNTTILLSISADNTVEKLLEALNHWDTGVRAHAAEFLGIMGDIRAVEPLIGSLQDEELNVRAMAAAALGKLRDTRALYPLVLMLRNESLSGNIRRWAATALGKLPHPDSIKFLCEALEDQDNIVRMYAAYAVGEIRDPNSVPSLIEALKDRGPRYAVAEALIQIGTPAVPALIHLLKNENKDVRLFSAEALGRIGDDRAIDALRGALQDPHILVRMKAAEAIAWLKS